MTWTRPLLITLGIALMACKQDGSHALVDFDTGKYHVGERWSYHTRPGEERSQITILKSERNSKLGVIVHVSVDGLRMKNPHAPNGYSDSIGHMPMSEAALEKSVTTMTSSSTGLPEFREGYDQWRAAFEQGKAGVFTVTIAEAIAGMEAGLNQ